MRKQWQKFIFGAICFFLKLYLTSNPKVAATYHWKIRIFLFPVINTLNYNISALPQMWIQVIKRWDCIPTHRLKSSKNAPVPDRHLRRGICPQPEGKAHPETESYIPRWSFASLSAGGASVAIYTVQAHTGSRISLPCMEWIPTGNIQVWFTTKDSKQVWGRKNTKTYNSN